MSLEFLERKKRAIETVLAMYKEFEAALTELPKEWADEIRRGIADHPSNQTQQQLPSGPDRDSSRCDDQEDDDQDDVATEAPLPPTAAVLSVIAQHPGLKANEIVRKLYYRVRTKATDRYKLLYTVLSNLRSSGRINRDDQDRYFSSE